MKSKMVSTAAVVCRSFQKMVIVDSVKLLTNSVVSVEIGSEKNGSDIVENVHEGR